MSDNPEGIKPKEPTSKFGCGTIGLAFLGFALIVGILLYAVGYRGGGSSSVDVGVPSYIKKVSAYKEGDGIIVYFILADDNGKMIASDGSVHLNIIHDGRSIYETTNAITPSNFQETEVGMGAFKHEALICSFGRISTSGLEGTGKVKIDFTHNGQTISGQETVFF